LSRASAYRPSELDKAIKEELERATGYDAWRRNGYANELSSEPLKSRTPTKSEQYADACKMVADYRGISIEQFFQREPQRYKQHRRLVLEE
jgi:hypothetical protein